VLAEFGLAGALQALVSKCPVPTRVDVSESRYPAEVESSAYYVACEALNNIVKHSGAMYGSISVKAHDGRLLLEIADNGAGGAVPNEGSGLQGMRDRVEALGGRLRVDSPAGRGTRIIAEIPCAS
jgi:signal transduction histidine kinase